MSKIVLDQPKFIAPIGQCEAAGVAQHMWVGTIETRATANGTNKVADRLSRHSLLSLGNEKPWKGVITLR